MKNPSKKTTSPVLGIAVLLGFLLAANLLDLYARQDAPSTQKNTRSIVVMVVQAAVCGVLLAELVIFAFAYKRSRRDAPVEVEVAPGPVYPKPQRPDYLQGSPAERN